MKRAEQLSDGLTGNLANHDMTQNARLRLCSGLLVRLCKTNFKFGHCEEVLFEDLYKSSKRVIARVHFPTFCNNVNCRIVNVNRNAGFFFFSSLRKKNTLSVEET